jgi:putative serine protease PepD
VTTAQDSGPARPGLPVSATGDAVGPVLQISGTRPDTGDQPVPLPGVPDLPPPLPWPVIRPAVVEDSPDNRTPRSKGRLGLAALVLATAVLAGSIGGTLGFWLQGRSSPSTDVSTYPPSHPKSISRPPDSIAGIATRTLPSVVTIKASRPADAPGAAGALGSTTLGAGTGSGFVFNRAGYILTNNHVVAPSAGGGALTVQFPDGNSYPATIVGRAQGYDLAVIKLATRPKETLVPLTPGDSDTVAVGDAVLAIGAPFGLTGTVTAGIISAQNRPVASGGASGTQTSYLNALQTDAPINPGNSGGPLMNTAGQVIGINSAIQSADTLGSADQAGSIGIGFAIPINQALWVADQLARGGQPLYPDIGIPSQATYTTRTGATIATTTNHGTPGITPGGPAATAGLRPGDVITRLDGAPIDSSAALISTIWSHHPNDKITITYTRNTQQHTTTLILATHTGDPAP